MVNITRTVALNNLMVDLKGRGYEVTESALKSCFDRVQRKYRLPSWYNMSVEQREETLLKARSKLIHSIESGMHRRKSWVLDGAGYTTREIYRLIGQDLAIRHSEMQLPTEQNFGRYLARLKKSASDVIERDGTIISHEALIHATTNFVKTAPCTIYQIDFIQGPHAGKKYVGMTQCAVSERIRWHVMNATRPGSPEKNPRNRLYKALRDSFNFSSKSERWLSIRILNTDVKLAEAKAAESDHCEIVAAEIGQENLLNVARPGSVGGRSGTRRVMYKKKKYYLHDGVRAVARDLKVDDKDTAKFIARYLYHFREQPLCDQHALDAVAERFARIGSSGGQLYREDAIHYLLNGKRFCIREAANITGRKPDQIRSALRCRGLLGVENADLTQVLSGSIPTISIKTPDTSHFYQKSDDIAKDLWRKVERVQSNCLGKSWLKLALYLGAKESSLRYTARRFENDVTAFWNKFLSDHI